MINISQIVAIISNVLATIAIIYFIVFYVKEVRKMRRDIQKIKEDMEVLYETQARVLMQPGGPMDYLADKIRGLPKKGERR